MADEAGGFLGRWARRKTEVLQGKPVDEPAASLPSVAVPASAPISGAVVSPDVAAVPPDAAAEQPPLSMNDVMQLTKDSDFKPFMAHNVGPELRNAAMKKLFADPHFNVMDGLDIYIDDYSKSDPIPDAMLRQMTSSKFLKLFEDEDEDEDEEGKRNDKGEQTDPAPRENANNPTDQTVAQSPTQVDKVSPDPATQLNFSQPESLPNGFDSVASQDDHASSHLRLQPDHAASAPEAGRGTQ